jgi:hypothetical protein
MFESMQEWLNGQDALQPRRGDTLRPRAAGITLFAVSGVTLTIAVGLSAVGHVSAIVQLIPFALSVPSLYLGWVTYRSGSSESARTELGEVANDLADTVGLQWETETRVRGLNNPGYLSVSWDPAPADLFDSWASLMKMARDAPGSSLAKGAKGAKGAAGRRPARLSGSGRELYQVMTRVPTGRLVVLGEPGSGKTVLLIRLLLDLLRNRQPGAVVPVLMSAASWNPVTQDLRSWLLAQLTRDYPDLKAPWKSRTRQGNLAQALLDQHLLLIMLDGLDEIPADIRGTAISQVNKFLPLGTGIVLSCRIGEYRETLSASAATGGPARLNGAAGVALRALDDHAIRDYIGRYWDGRGDEIERWEPVLRVLGTPVPVAEALSTPLMIGLARAVYDPRPDEQAGTAVLAPPAELCDTVAFPARDDIEVHLFRAFIPAAYRPRDDPAKNRWDPADAQRWLAFLAHHFQQGSGEGELAWWKLRSAAPGWLVPAVVGIISGLASGLAAGFGRHVGFGIGIGLGVGALAGLAIGTGIRQASRRKGRPAVGIAGALIGAITGGILAGIHGSIGATHHVGPFGGLAVALAVGIGVGSSTNLVGGLAGGLPGGFLAVLLEGFGKGLPAGLVNGAGMGLAAALATRFVGRATPAFRLRWSWQAGAVCGLAIGTAVGLIAGHQEGLPTGLIAGGAIGVLSAVPCSLTASAQQEKAELTAFSPADALRYDYRTFRRTGLSAGIAAAVAGLLGGGLVSVAAVHAQPRLGLVVADGLGIGLAAGIIVGLGFGLYHAASGSFLITRLWLSANRALPWRLMTFLDDAHQERGILRQAGTVYQFRHIELQRWLASQYRDGNLRQGSNVAPPPRPYRRVIPGLGRARPAPR